MIKSLLVLLCLQLAAIRSVQGQVTAPAPFGPMPTEQQLKWQKMEYYAFVHLSVNTYTDMAWGFGDEKPAIFNPEKLDCRQWARICKEAGMKGIIITAKHHSGFCLWPSKYTEYSVKNSPWKNGKGDIVRELADACKEYGLKMGIYLSPWDRNHPEYGTPAYITYFRNQLTELLTEYGDVFEVWYDGANGGTGYYGGANENRKIDRTTYYDWSNTYQLVRKLQPDIVIWNDGGDRADLRWVGTESGYVGEKNWSLLNAKGDVPEDMLRHGVEEGDSWVPGEVNTSTRPEWFYHPKEDNKVKTLPQLLDIYYQSVSRNATLLLNFPVTPEGLIHEKDEKAVLDLAKALDEAFKTDLSRGSDASASSVRGNSPVYDARKTTDGDPETYWTTNDGTNTGSVTLDFGKPATFNRFLVQEYIRLGQRVKSFTVEALIDGTWKELARETTVGYKRILRFPSVTATKLRFSILDSKSCPLISNISVYHAPQVLIPPVVQRNQSGDIIIRAADPDSEIYYTLDGTQPSSASAKYTGPVKTGAGKVNIKAVALDPATQKNSALTEESFDISRKRWKVLAEADAGTANIIDGIEETSWKHKKEVKMPADLVIDLGKTENLSGFRYLPEQHWWADGSIITHYEFYVSLDNIKWQRVSKGEFPNIKNNPLWQVKSFDPVKARYIKLRALQLTKSQDTAGYAEIDIITK